MAKKEEMNNMIREMQEMTTGSQTTITNHTPHRSETNNKPLNWKQQNIFVKNEYYLCVPCAVRILLPYEIHFKIDPQHTLSPLTLARCGSAAKI